MVRGLGRVATATGLSLGLIAAVGCSAGGSGSGSGALTFASGVSDTAGGSSSSGDGTGSATTTASTTETTTTTTTTSATGTTTDPTSGSTGGDTTDGSSGGSTGGSTTGGSTESEVVTAGPGLALAIPDDAYVGGLIGMACVNLSVAANGVDTLTLVQVELGMTHTWIGDLTIKLVSPSGTMITLMSIPGVAEAADNGQSFSNEDADLLAANAVMFRDAGVTNAELMGASLALGFEVVCLNDGLCDYIPNNGAAPAGNLGTLVGQTAVGNWQLCVGDSEAQDTGAIDLVRLTLDQTS